MQRLTERACFKLSIRYFSVCGKSVAFFFTQKGFVVARTLLAYARKERVSVDFQFFHLRAVFFSKIHTQSHKLTHVFGLTCKLFSLNFPTFGFTPCRFLENSSCPPYLLIIGISEAEGGEKSAFPPLHLTVANSCVLKCCIFLYSTKGLGCFPAGFRLFPC